MTINRRSFLESTAILSAAAHLGNTASHAAEAKTTVNFALVGLGSLSTNQIAPALQKTKHAKLMGIVTGTPAKEKIWAEKYGIAKQNIYNYDNFEKLADNDAIAFTGGGPARPGIGPARPVRRPPAAWHRPGAAREAALSGQAAWLPGEEPGPHHHTPTMHMCVPACGQVKTAKPAK